MPYSTEKMREYRKEWNKKNPEKVREIRRKHARKTRYPRKPAVFNRTGLDVPMIPPAWIPKGYVQDFVESEMRWKVRPEGRRHYLPYFPVINFENPGEPVDFLI